MYNSKVLAQGWLDAGKIDSKTRRSQYNLNGQVTAQYIQRLSDGASRQLINYTQYDGAGNNLQYKVHDLDGGYTNTYNTTYKAFDGYRQAQVNATSTYFRPGTTTYGYDAGGNLTSVADSQNGANNQRLVNDVAGHILYKSQSGKETYNLVANGQQMATYHQAELTSTTAWTVLTWPCIASCETAHLRI